MTHLLLADSGLGGLSVCARLERRLRAGGAGGPLLMSFFNAAPAPREGYNDLPDLPARAALLEHTLTAMEALHPDRIVLACNTLSVLYPHTAHARGSSSRVTGILEPGVRLFVDALAADPGAALLLLGTRTTIESQAHRRRLLAAGVAPERLAALPCHGLARAIEADPEAAAVGALIEQCATALPPLHRGAQRLYVGLACTHYGYAGERIRAALQKASGLPVRLLDPGEALVEELIAAGPPASAGPSPGQDRPEISVRVLSKVPLPEASRRAIAARLRPLSGLTARALLSYTCDPELF